MMITMAGRRRPASRTSTTTPSRHVTCWPQRLLGRLPPPTPAAPAAPLKDVPGESLLPAVNEQENFLASQSTEDTEEGEEDQ